MYITDIQKMTLLFSVLPVKKQKTKHGVKQNKKTFWMYEDFNFIVLRGIMNKMHEVCLYKRFNFEFIVFINLRENYFFFYLECV